MSDCYDAMSDNHAYHRLFRNHFRKCFNKSILRLIIWFILLYHNCTHSMSKLTRETYSVQEGLWNVRQSDRESDITIAAQIPCPTVISWTVYKLYFMTVSTREHFSIVAANLWPVSWYLSLLGLITSLTVQIMSDCGFYGACLGSDFSNIRRFGHMRSSLRFRNVPGAQLLQISQKVTVVVLRKLDFGEKSTFLYVWHLSDIGQTGREGVRLYAWVVRWSDFGLYIPRT